MQSENLIPRKYSDDIELTIKKSKGHHQPKEIIMKE